MIIDVKRLIQEGKIEKAAEYYNELERMFTVYYFDRRIGERYES